MSVKFSEIVRVSSGTCRRETINRDDNRWVWIEDYDKPTPPVNKMKPEIKRTRYSIWETTAPPERDVRLVNDKSYAQLRVDGITLFWLDKSKIERVLRSLVPTPQRGVIELLKSAYRSGKLPEQSVLVMKNYGHSIKTEQYQFKAYCPVQGFWVGAPRLEYIHTQHSEEYRIVLPYNNEKTERCNQFVIKNKLYAGFMENEATGVIKERYEALHEFKFDVRHILCDVSWECRSDEAGIQKVYIDRHYPEKTMEEMRKSRDDFKEQIVMAVFHPTRVEKMMDKYGWGEGAGGEGCWFDKV